MIGQDPEVAFNVTQAVCEAVDIPVIIKLTPDQSKPVEIARAAQEAGAAAVTATNRYTGFAVDIDTAAASWRNGGYRRNLDKATFAQIRAQYLQTGRYPDRGVKRCFRPSRYRGIYNDRRRCR